MAVPFISVQDFIDLTGRGGTADPGLLIAIDAACETVRAMTELNVNRVTGGTATLNGNDSDTLLLPQRPVYGAGTVVLNGGTITDYCYDANGVLYRGTADADPRGTWPSGRQNVVVTYDYGWLDDDIPRDIRMVALQLASRIAIQGVAVEESMGQTRVRYAGPALDLTNGEKAILQKYRQIR